MSERRDRAAFAIHDAQCSDRCDPMAMGKFYRQAACDHDWWEAVDGPDWCVNCGAVK